jgi:hypothetical protein
VRSQEFDNASWTKAASGVGVAPVVTANQAIAPDGTLTADQIIFSLGGGTVIGDWSSINSTPAITITNGTAYTYSVWLKSADANSYVVLARDDTGSSGTSVLWTVTPTWQRFSYTATSSSTSSSGLRLWLRGTLGTSSTADVYVWGAQLEAASFASSYVKSEAAAATRAADVLTYTAGVSYPLSLWAEFERVVNTGAALVPVGVSLTSGERTELAILADNTGRAYQVTGAALVGEVSNGTSLSLTAAIKMAGRFGTNITQLSVNGGIGTQDTSAAAPSSPTLLTIGTRNSTSDPVFGYIRRIAVFNSALTDAQLQTVTGS